MLLYIHFSGDDDMKHRKELKRQRKIIVISLFTVLLCLSIGYAAFSTNINLSAKGNLKDKSRTIQSWSETSNEDFHTDFYRENIVSATFLDNAVVPSDAVEKWDVSEAKDQGVMAYVMESTSETGKYNLYIGAKNGVIANQYSYNFFYKFKNLKYINFNNNFDTNNVVDFTYFFGICTSLISVDLNNFNTSKTTKMGGMFEENSSIEYIDVSNFDTNNVVSMWYMFANCSSLTELDVSNFITSNVVNMEYMFSSTYNIEELNLCNFDTKNISRTDHMFAYTNNLKNVYVGTNWKIPKNANSSNMFTDSNISSVTTGKCNS